MNLWAEGVVFNKWLTEDKEDISLTLKHSDWLILASSLRVLYADGTLEL